MCFVCVLLFVYCFCLLILGIFSPPSSLVLLYKVWSIAIPFRSFVESVYVRRNVNIGIPFVQSGQVEKIL